MFAPKIDGLEGDLVLFWGVEPICKGIVVSFSESSFKKTPVLQCLN